AGVRVTGGALRACLRTGKVSPNGPSSRLKAAAAAGASWRARAPAAPATPSPATAISAAQTAAATPAAAPRQTAARATAAATTATRVSASDFNLQVATLKARDRAQSYAAELMIKHAGIIGNAQADVDQTLVAGRGTRYRVRLGPFPSRQASLNACKELKGVGVDCFLIR
ncbi:MAG: SPOR domain-containing protein, partial [Pseudomonadota bacterium]